MDELSSLIFSTTNIVGAVVGLVVGICVNYFQRWIDATMGAWSATRRARSEARYKELRKQVALHKTHPELLPFLMASEVRHRFNALRRLLVAVLMSTLIFMNSVLIKSSAPAGGEISLALLGVCALFVLIRGLSHLNEATRISLIMHVIHLNLSEDVAVSRSLPDPGQVGRDGSD
jgi:hypothetical protein